MRIEVNGVRLWFDVEGLKLVPEGPKMVERPTIVLLHGGPGSYDHSYFKPDFAKLTKVAQVVYLEMHGHGRSSRGNPRGWSFGEFANDLRAFCNTLEIAKPIVFGHSLGGFVAMVYAARHPDQPGALVLQSTLGRFDLARIVEGFRIAGGEEAARVAERFYRGDLSVVTEFRARCRPLFGRWVPGVSERARMVLNDDLLQPGLELMREFDVLEELALVTCPTLVCTGALDPVTRVADAREIADALVNARPRVEVIAKAGHFPWKDAPDRYWPMLTDFVAGVGGAAGR
jgi:proline iminopeptidase